MWIACSWRPDESGELVRLFAEIDRVQLLVPVDVGSSQSGGPLELEIPGESSFDFKRLLGFDFEQDHRAHLIHSERTAFRGRGRNRRHTKSMPTRASPSAFARDFQREVRGRRHERSGGSREKSSADRPRLQIVPFHHRIIPRGTRRLGETPSFVRCALIRADAAVLALKMMRSKLTVTNTNKERMRAKRRVIAIIFGRYLAAPELAKSRLPEYKREGANSSTTRAGQVATSCSLHAAFF